jgi:hypothetical protein
LLVVKINDLLNLATFGNRLRKMVLGLVGFNGLSLEEKR